MRPPNQLRVVTGPKPAPQPGTGGFGEAAPGQEGSPWTPDPVPRQQCRHLARHALRRLMAQVALHPGLLTGPQGQALAEELEACVQLTLAIPGAVFRLTGEAGSLERRLVALCCGTVAWVGDGDQEIAVDVSVTGRCPGALEDIVVHVAHELVGNAVRHGMHARLIGRIRVRVRTEGRRTTLAVTDDGWGCGAVPAFGEGLTLASMRAAAAGGSLCLRSGGGTTIAELTLPHGSLPSQGPAPAQ